MRSCPYVYSAKFVKACSPLKGYTQPLVLQTTKTVSLVAAIILGACNHVSPLLFHTCLSFPNIASRGEK